MSDRGSDAPRPRRPVVGSRHATARPRRVAGTGGGSQGAPDPVEATAPPVGETQADTGSTRLADPPAESPPVESPPPPAETTPEPPAIAPRRGTAGLVALVVAAVLLVGVAVVEAWYVWGDHEPVVSAERPVVTGEIAHRAAVEAAAQAADDIFSTSWKDYDAQVDQAATMMTAEFEQTYRQTAGDVQADFVRQRKEVQVQVAATGVVRASDDQVQALVFLNQYATTDGKDTTFTPYRVLVTVVHTDGGWLVSDIQTA